MAYGCLSLEFCDLEGSQRWLHAQWIQNQREFFVFGVDVGDRTCRQVVKPCHGENIAKASVSKVGQLSWRILKRPRRMRDGHVSIRSEVCPNPQPASL